jgi:hypothetical protein
MHDLLIFGLGLLTARAVRLARSLWPAAAPIGGRHWSEEEKDE